MFCWESERGSLWATRKDEKLNGLKFLVVERQLDDNQADPLP